MAKKNAEPTSPLQSHTKISPSPSTQSTPKRSLPATPEVTQRTVESKPKSLPWEVQGEAISDDEESEVSVVGS